MSNPQIIDITGIAGQGGFFTKNHSELPSKLPPILRNFSTAWIVDPGLKLAGEFTGEMVCKWISSAIAEDSFEQAEADEGRPSYAADRLEREAEGIDSLRIKIERVVSPRTGVHGWKLSRVSA